MYHMFIYHLYTIYTQFTTYLLIYCISHTESQVQQQRCISSIPGQSIDFFIRESSIMMRIGDA